MCLIKYGSLLLLSCSLFLTVTAQDKYGKAFYVTPKNDTIHGFIDYQDNYVREITFKKDMKSRSQCLGPEEVKSFTFQSGNSYEFINFADKNNTANQVFAKKLLVGSLSLYSSYSQFLMGSDEKSFFIVNKGKPSTSGEALTRHQKNVGAFNVLFNDCPAVATDAQKSVVAEEQLLILLKKYHDCKSAPYKEYLPVGKRRFQFGVFGGVSFSDISFSGEEDALNATTFSKSVDPSFGLIILLTPSRKPESIFSLQLELLYTSMQFGGTAYGERLVAGYDIRVASSTTVESHRLTPKFGFRFSGRSNILNPYISCGVGVPNLLPTKSHNIETVKINDSITTTESDPVDINGVTGSIAVGLKKSMRKGNAFYIDVTFETVLASPGGKVAVMSPRLGYMF